jgi:hypothetical protein
LFEIMQQIIQIDLGRLDALRRYEGARTDPSLLFRSTFEEGLIGHLIGAGYITYLYRDDEAFFTGPHMHLKAK